jgi:hypothetical protein
MTAGPAVQGFVFREPSLGQTPIASTLTPNTNSVESSTPAFGTINSSPQPAGRSTPGRLGSIAKAYHPTYGEGEFIYLLGVASTAIGTVVNWGGVSASGVPTYQTAIEGATPVKGQPLAIAMSANLAGAYGWYQIGGQAVVATNGTLVAGPGPVFLAAGGTVTSTAAAGAQIENAINVTATGTPAAGFAIISIDRPFAEGQIT